jgi:CRISPR/Cas system CSM-associated protein Csm2 small subunit
MSQLTVNSDDLNSENMYKEILNKFRDTLEQSLTIEGRIKKSEEEILKALDDILDDVFKTIDHYETKIKTLKKYIKNISNELTD